MPDEFECPDGTSHETINEALNDLDERFEALKRGSCTQGDVVKNQVIIHEIMVKIICVLRECCDDVSSSSSSSDASSDSSGSSSGSVSSSDSNSSSASVASSSSSSVSNSSSQSVPSSSSSSDSGSSSSSGSASSSSSDDRPDNVMCCEGEVLPAVLECEATFGDATVVFDVFVNNGDGSAGNPICWYPNISGNCLDYEVDPSDPCFWCTTFAPNPDDPPVPDRLNQQMLIPCEICCLKNATGWDFYITMYILCKQRVDGCDAPLITKQAPTKIATGTCDPFSWTASGTVTDTSGNGATCAWSATFTPS